MKLFSQRLMFWKLGHRFGMLRHGRTTEREGLVRVVTLWRTLYMARVNILSWNLSDFQESKLL